MDKRARDSCPKQEAHQYPDLRPLTKLYSAIFTVAICSFCCSLLLPVPSVACPTPTLPELDLNRILLRLTGSAKTCDRQIRVGRGLGRSYEKLNLLTAAHAKVYQGQVKVLMQCCSSETSTDGVKMATKSVPWPSDRLGELSTARWLCGY